VNCPRCGEDVPDHLKHLPSRETNGKHLGGCMMVSVDKEGRSNRERIAWTQLRKAASGGKRV